MKKIAIYAGLFAVLASPLAALATPAAQSSMKSDSDSVTITGRVSCSRFGGGSAVSLQRRSGLMNLLMTSTRTGCLKQRFHNWAGFTFAQNPVAVTYGPSTCCSRT